MIENADTEAAPFEACYSPRRIAPYLLGSLAFVALSWFLAAKAPHLPVRMAGIAGILTFGAFSLLYAIKLLDRRVQVRIDGRGLVCLAHSDQPIGLRSIKRVGDRGAYVSIYLYKPRKYPPTRAARRLLLVVNERLSPGATGDVFVQIALLDCRRAALFDALARHRPMTDFERDLARRSAMARGQAGREA